MYTEIHSKSKESLSLTLFAAKEGLSNKGFDIYEGILTAQEFAEHFQAEASTEVINEYKKRQRNLEKARAEGLIEYFESRDDTVLPSVTIFVANLEVVRSHCIGTKKILEAVLEANTDRLVIDGQNRLNIFTNILKNGVDVADQTIGVKFISTNTHNLASVGREVKQVFSDYHFKLKKPTASQNIFFDSSQPTSLFLRENVLGGLQVNGASVKPYIATNKATKYQLMDLKALGDFICKCLATSPKQMNTQLKGENCEENRKKLFNMCKPFLEQFFEMIPLTSLGDVGSGVMFNKAIYWYGVGYLINAMIEDALSEGKEVDWSQLNKLCELPLGDMSDPFWVNNKIVVEIDNLGRKTYKMMKGSEKVLGRLLCQHLRVYYSQALS